MTGTESYFPGPDAWESVTPELAGVDPARLKEAIDFHVANETKWSREIVPDISANMFEPPPWNEILGHVRPRGGPSGLLVRGGRIVAEWGEPDRPDVTFSVAKSFVSTCVGLAWEDGLIPDLDAPVGEIVHDGHFDGPHNGAVTWTHLLQQTSEWEGTLWDKPEQIDRFRDLDREGYGERKGEARALQAPGSYWEYNDVRVNLLALAALRVLRRSLPEVLRERVMDPIGCSGTWEWHGYRNSWLKVDGRWMQSVSGGTHWGGGMFISSYDQARFGLLALNKGRWNGRQLLRSDWFDMALRPCPQNPLYGFMWWLNTDQASWSGAPANAFAARGAGANVIVCLPDQDAVVVARWIDRDAIAGFVERMAAAME